MWELQHVFGLREGSAGFLEKVAFSCLQGVGDIFWEEVVLQLGVMGLPLLTVLFSPVVLGLQAREFADPPRGFCSCERGGKKKIPARTNKRGEINEIKGWVYPRLDPNSPNPAHGCGASG